MNKTLHNRRLAKKRVQCLNEALCFVSSSVLADSFELRNPLLRQAPKRYAAFKRPTYRNIRTTYKFNIGPFPTQQPNALCFIFFADQHFLKTILASRTSGTFGFAQ